MDKEEIREKADIVAIASQYTKLAKRGNEFVGLCPFHTEKTPSFSVNPTRGIATCFGGCGTFDVFKLVQTAECIDFAAAKKRVESMIGLAPPPEEAARFRKRKASPPRVTTDPPPDASPPDFNHRQLGDPISIHPICRLDGFVIGYEARYIDGDGKKQPRIWTWESKKWGIGQFNEPRPLYGLHTLTQKPKAPAIITEGPKKADAVIKLLPMYASLSLLNGCNSVHKHDWTPLRDRSIILWPDADPQGIEAMRRIAEILAHPEGMGLSVRMIHPIDMPHGWDAADAFDEGWTTEQTIAFCKKRITDFDLGPA